MTYLIYITAFILGIICGNLTKKCPAPMIENKPSKREKGNIEVLHKAQPTTYKEKQQQAIKSGTPIIKTFHKRD